MTFLHRSCFSLLSQLQSTILHLWSQLSAVWTDKVSVHVPLCYVWCYVAGIPYITRYCCGEVVWLKDYLWCDYGKTWSIYLLVSVYFWNFQYTLNVWLTFRQNKYSTYISGWKQNNLLSHQPKLSLNVSKDRDISAGHRQCRHGMVNFLSSHPCRHLYFLQIRSDIREGRLVMQYKHKPKLNHPFSCAQFVLNCYNV